MSTDHAYRIARFIISGGIATATNLAALYILVHIVGMWYLLASVIAFLIGFVASFTLQKFWTFRDHATDQIRTQLTRYFLIVLVNLGLNTLLVYAFVEYVGMMPVFAQAAAALIIAIEGYFAYQILVFKKGPAVVE